MRVIAGEKRGLVLFSPKDRKIRPTSDKIKGAIFNSIQNRLSEEAVFVDAFAGSGAMGIEALSRGVKEAWFFDVSAASIALVKKNIARCGFQDRAKILHCSASQGLNRMAQAGICGDLIFMDPPYIHGEETIALGEAIQIKKLLKKDGILMIEHDKNDIMPLRIKKLIQTKRKTYGITAVSFFEFDREAGADSSGDE